MADPALVSGDRSCVGCGYNLLGASIAGVCPECGLPVAQSMGSGMLDDASPAYRARLVRGLGWIIHGVLALIVLTIGAALASSFLNVRSDLLVEGVSLVPVCVIYAGYWLCSQPEPGYNGTDEPRATCAVLRVGVAAMAACTLGRAVGAPLRTLVPATGGMLKPMLALLALARGLAMLVTLFCTLQYTRWIAWRIPSPKWSRRAGTYRWLLPVLIGGPLLLWLISGIVVAMSIAPAGSGVGMAPVAVGGVALAGVAGCMTIVASLVVLVLFWNLLHYVREGVRSIDVQKRRAEAYVTSTPT